MVTTTEKCKYSIGGSIIYGIIFSLSPMGRLVEGMDISAMKQAFWVMRLCRRGSFLQSSDVAREEEQGSRTDMMSIQLGGVCTRHLFRLVQAESDEAGVNHCWNIMCLDVSPPQ